ncbi:MAG TPA: hypothetical protein ENI32_04170 [Candidatus Syntrophoarchaeum butanivorans]|uniref:KaiC domain-containing protein n=1 Tax=Candidatus Syntropharchaeum butanivorans TaxID=1839936 RepID=A0A7J2S132_9EURY|nr:MAG: hypothetical protein CW694_03500 [Candidatus Syntrophoarchaeum sp. WYZ-LMO15]HEC57065.1 hypothetical protein [Candidatus Syntrophoarchaeum butanivorans]
MMDRIRTYIAGMDECLEGGIPAGSVTLICGRPGSMKSSLAYNILYKNAINEDRKSVYVTLEQTPDSLMQHMSSLQMSPHERITMVSYNEIEGELVRLRLDQRLEQNWIKRLSNYLRNLCDTDGYSLLVIDSLNGLYSLTKVDMPRREVFLFFKALREMKFTTFLISEMGNEPSFSNCGVEDFLADGIIHLDLDRDQSTNTLALRIGIVKMRCTNIGRQYFPLIYRDGTFSIMRKPIEP